MWTAAVIGLGRVGMGYDFHAPASCIQTHARAFSRHPDFRLVAGVDPSPAKRKIFSARYRVDSYANVRALYEKKRPDVVAIAVPTDRHYSVFQEVIAHAPKAVLCEKPISRSLNEAEKMISEARKKRCVLAVNYVRRFDPGVHRLRAWVRAGRFGTGLNGIVRYERGLFNNASHYTDLCIYLFGDVIGTEMVRRGDRRKNDPEPDFFLNFKNVRVFFQARKKVTGADMELVGSKGRLRYSGGGAVIRFWPRSAAKKVMTIPNRMRRYQWSVLEELAVSLRRGRPMASDGESAFGTLKVLHELLSGGEKK